MEHQTCSAEWWHHGSDGRAGMRWSSWNSLIHHKVTWILTLLALCPWQGTVQTKGPKYKLHPVSCEAQTKQPCACPDVNELPGSSQGNLVFIGFYGQLWVAGVAVMIWSQTGFSIPLYHCRGGREKKLNFKPGGKGGEAVLRLRFYFLIFLLD